MHIDILPIDHRSDLLTPSCGELERQLSQKIQTLYKQHLGQRPTRVTCHLFGQELAIIIESSTTQIEQLLSCQGASGLSSEVSRAVNQRLKQDITRLIESILQIGVQGILIDTSIELERTGIIALLAETPTVRNPELVPKTSAYKQARKRRLRAIDRHG
ncbi:MAG: Na-translocating system protein MpsC family protein [Cyanobacteria bacterium P01_A01_bin.15]